MLVLVVDMTIKLMLKVILGLVTWMTQSLRALAALLDEWNPVPSTPVSQQLMTTCNSSSGASVTPFWPLREGTALVWHTLTQTHAQSQVLKE